jgi:hypothetical protein
LLLGQFVHFGSMAAEPKTIAVLLKAETYWPRPEGLTHRTSRDPHWGEGEFSFSIGERKLMVQFVVSYSSDLVAALPRCVLYG